LVLSARFLRVPDSARDDYDRPNQLGRPKVGRGHEIGERAKLAVGPSPLRGSEPPGHDVAVRRGELRCIVAFAGEPSALTTILVVSDLDRAKSWYLEVLGADLYGEYGGASVVLSFLGAWLLLVTGAGPSDDKPTITFAEPTEPDRVDHAFTIRVADCHGAYEDLRSRGALFLTPPFEHGSETRCFFRDPDGHLFEISAVG
jgi:catechol 2,3-dioxygenase-like lactoylglutathione lyase family enzyme